MASPSRERQSSQVDLEMMKRIEEPLGTLIQRNLEEPSLFSQRLATIRKQIADLQRDGLCAGLSATEESLARAEADHLTARRMELAKAIATTAQRHGLSLQVEDRKVERPLKPAHRISQVERTKWMDALIAYLSARAGSPAAAEEIQSHLKLPSSRIKRLLRDAVELGCIHRSGSSRSTRYEANKQNRA